jgi:hypothetical protein
MMTSVASTLFDRASQHILTAERQDRETKLIVRKLIQAVQDRDGALVELRAKLSAFDWIAPQRFSAQQEPE